MIAQATVSSSTPSQASRLATVEALLRERKLDRTLSTSRPEAGAADSMPLDVAPLDARLAGGLPRGQLSEVVGPASSGRTSLVWTWLGAATRRGEHAALVDTFDRFDPASGVSCGIVLPRLLWVRGQAISKTASAVDPAWRPGVRTVQGPGTLLERTIDRALKALNLIVQSGVCTAVALDLADVPVPTLGRIPASTWLRVQRILEGSDMACVVLGPAPIARSAGGITMSLASGREAVGDRREPGRAGMRAPAPPQRSTREGTRARWRGVHDRVRRFEGLDVSARLMSPRRRVAGSVAIDAQIDPAV